ncbi:ATP-binding protein [Draconibacterium sp. IB214405]|uniref:ATP-binding protein n=1 Tax=Draconibacterium sp. IB214405 TaxID=3097352 RepID=UPI002A10CF59|nr:ATP-binding protein [Draconibacterium sp. IB214405]MDX8337837.1 ATP-binding protein [Draconibacterium sp. IB214405]
MNENNELIVITGLKRTGKKSVLFQLKNRYSDAAFYVNFRHPGFYGFDQNDFFKLDEIIASSGAKILLFESITSMDGWQDYIRQKLDEGFKVIFTTSNAAVLNNEKGRSLTGRYISRVITPLSYDEFCTYHSLARDENSVKDYIAKGGFFVPETNRDEFLGQLFDDIVVREIGLTNGIRDLRAFKRLSLHLLRHVGEMITANQIKNTLGIKTTTTAVDYLNYLESGLLMYYVPKFSYSLRKQLVNPRKVYVADTGFVSAATFNIAEKAGQLLENLVFLYLQSKYTELYYFSEDAYCDFIGFGKDQAKVAVQVCVTLEQDNLEREINGLLEAMEFFDFDEGTLVTLSQTDTFIRDDKTIQVVPFYEFATQK